MSNLKSMIEKMMEDQRRFQEQMKQALGSQKTFQEAMKQALGPSDILREQMKKIRDPYHGLRDAAMQMMIRQGDQAHALQREAQKWMHKFQEPLIERLRMQETITESINLQKRLADQFMKIPPAQHFTWRSEVQMHWTAGAETHLSRFDPGTIKVTTRGDIVMGKNTVHAEDIKTSMVRLSEELADVSTPVEYFQRVFSFLDSLKPRLAQVIFRLILPYLLGVLGALTTPIYEPYWKELTGFPKKEVATKIRENILNRYDPSQLKDHRFVTANRLQVRAGPSKEKKVLGVLPRGKLVRIIKVKQHWTKVEYLDEREKKEHRGWVATSHLGKLTE